MRVDKNIVIQGAAGKQITLDVFSDPSRNAAPLLIFAHGFKGFKDWGPWEEMAKAFVNKGFTFLKFNFSHNGTTPENPLEFGDLVAFGNNNFSHELYDIEQVINWISAPKQAIKYQCNINSLNLIGHSRANATLVIHTANDPRVQKLASWAGVDSLENYLRPEMAEEWETLGVQFIPNARTNQQMPLYFQLYEDIKTHKEEFDIGKMQAIMKQPYLVIHGTNDSAVPYQAAINNHERAQHAELETIEGADHVFGGAHPWTSTRLPDDLQKVIDRTTEFFLRTIK
ncbi:MAG: alpha/beta superfamily hydrolase [Limisphaerales bacterium]|jgi:alpha/beta superfamily hydrolase